MTILSDRRSRVGAVAGGAVLTMAALALANSVAARRAEDTHPPRGRIISVDGNRLHVMRFGPPDPVGPPVVLLHGNLVASGDWLASGIVGRLAAEREVVVFDRPGFGHSDRPRGMDHGARGQAALLREACHLEGIVRPVVVGHSWATLVALAWALDAPRDITGIGLFGGYYYPTFRLDALLVAPVAMPVLGDVLRHTVSPPLTRAGLSGTLKGMFDPCPVPAGYRGAVPPGMVCRPSQIGATAEEGATMAREAASLVKRLGELRLPVGIMAGREDQVVDSVAQSVRFADHVTRHSSAGVDLWVEPRAGHMVHHAAPDHAVRLIAGIDGGGRAR